jgi:hypothetical protein
MARCPKGAEIFHPGTVAKNGNILASGRVLNVCVTGKTVAEAQQRAHAAVDRIKCPMVLPARYRLAGGGTGARQQLTLAAGHPRPLTFKARRGWPAPASVQDEK